MSTIRTASRTGLMIGMLALAGGAASADTIFDTGTPDGGFLGYYGFDLFVDQSVAIAFTTGQDYTLDQVGLWMMSNNFASPGAEYTISLRTDAAGGMTIPGDTVIESWDVQTAAVGWNPILETVDSVLNPVLTAGTTYWIVAESDGSAGSNAVWVASNQLDSVYHSIQNVFNPGGDWISGYTTGAPGMVINGTPVPAPAGAAMLGLGGLLAARRRR